MGFASPALQVSHAKASQGDLKSSQEHPRRAVTHPHPFPQGSALLDAPIQHKCGSGLCAWGCKMLHVSPDHTTWNNAAQTKNYSSLCVFHPHRARCLSSDNSFALWTSNHPMSSLPDKGWGQKDVTMDGRTGKRRGFFPPTTTTVLLKSGQHLGNERVRSKRWLLQGGQERETRPEEGLGL